MKQNSTLIFVFFIFIAFGFEAVSAQFSLKIPKLPKTEKPSQEQPKTADNGKNQTEGSTISQSQSPNQIQKTFTKISVQPMCLLC